MLNQNKTKIKEGLEIFIDQNSSLNYETKKWVYFLTRPLIWLLTGWVYFKKRILGIKPKINTLWFDGLSIHARQVKENAGSWRALDLIYNAQFGKNLKEKISNYWSNIISAQGVRNRLKLVKKELTRVIKEFQKERRKIQLLSIASGSAQAVIEVIEKFKDTDLSLKVNLVDLDPTAVDFSRQLAKKHGVENMITFTCDNLYRYLKRLNKNRPDIIEMVGFLDYLTDRKAIYLFSIIYQILLPGGIFLTANICPNGEKNFLKYVVEWPMIYRKPEDLGNLLLGAGFKDCKIILEPLKIFAVAICRKEVTLS